MRALLVIAVLFVVFLLIGWLRFGSVDGDPTLQVDSERVRQDTEQVVDQSKELVNKAAVEVDRAAEKVDASIDRDPVE